MNKENGLVKRPVKFGNQSSCLFQQTLFEIVTGSCNKILIFYKVKS